MKENVKMNKYGKFLTPAEQREFQKAMDAMDIEEPKDKKGDEVADKQEELF